mgnify:CR=1 FL=1
MIINYLIIGIVFAVFIEYTKDRIRSKWPSLLPTSFDLDIVMRFMMIILWPLCLLVFCIGFYKTYYKK